MRRLYWFRNDLRLEDNPGLAAQAEADRLLLVYLWPVNRPWCNVTGRGAQRERFLHESVEALRDDLRTLGQDLLVLHGSPEIVLPDLVRTYGIDSIGTCRTPGYYERTAVERLRQRLPVPVEVFEHGTLFTEAQLPFSLGQLPGHFTPFRRKLDDLTPAEPLPCPASLPGPPSASFDSIPPTGTRPHPALPIRGGSAPARRRLHQFVFGEQAITRYKQTRNCLDALDGSSTLSPWLANGCLSPREVVATVRRFEEQHTANESTCWLYFELLWREYFHWRALRDDINLFRPGYRHTTLHQCTFEPRSFARWCAGDTDSPLVNAVMRQLVATGWASNRGRQVAASYLVNELRIDWRYGAAFFEKHLVDYDVASNYGNWQYLAGVGADPRGGRHLDPAKQARDHDPEGRFVARWEGDRPAQPKYVTDAADWPISSS